MIHNFKIINNSSLYIWKFVSSYNLKVIKYDGENSYTKLIDNIKELNDNLNDNANNIKKFFNFLNNLMYWMVHPIEFLKVFQPWVIILLMIMIVLKILGFKIDKWFRLFFLLFFLSLIL